MDRIATFDFPAKVPEALPPGKLQQRYTQSRTIYSMAYGLFRARQIVKEFLPDDPTKPAVIYRSEQLAQLVAPGDRYAFDLIVEVGLKSLLDCRRLEEVAQELVTRCNLPPMSLQTLWRLQQKFLGYLGALHQASLPALAQYFQQRPGSGYVLMIDSTCEDGPPALFVAFEPTSGIVLGSWKLSSENKEEVANALRDIQQQLGDPYYILLDLGQALHEGASQVFPDVPQKNCHFHFLSDVGEDLCDPPQKKLRKALRAHKLQSSLKTLRVDLRRRLLQMCRELQETPSLYRCLQGDISPEPHPRILQQQMLLSIHEWIADYASDGHREGYPFDPFFLYFHRRLVRARQTLEEMLKQPDLPPNDFTALRNLRTRLENYLRDPQVLQAAHEFEESHDYLQRLRQALRLPRDDESSTPRSQTYDLPGGQATTVADCLDCFVEQLRAELRVASASQKRPIEILLKHLDKYGPQLKYAPAKPSLENEIPRTTNAIEQLFRQLKRLRRRVHGRGNLRRDLLHLPTELPLVLNLTNSIYLQLTIGNLQALPNALSQYTEQAKKRIKDRKVDHATIQIRLPKRTLRQDDFLDALPALTEHAVTR
ncbi:MAG: hypothetical protein GY906_15060 [bacterium]|nr:hypothetical protein [bacterium]